MDILLVPLIPAHAPVFSRATAVPGFLDGLLYPEPLSCEAAELDILLQLQQQRAWEMHVYSIQYGMEIVGRIGARKKEEWQVWYWVVPEAQGNGVGKEALRLFMEKHTLPLVARVSPWNTASLQMLLRAGFTEDGKDEEGRTRLRMSAVRSTRVAHDHGMPLP